MAAAFNLPMISYVSSNSSSSRLRYMLRQCELRLGSHKVPKVDKHLPRIVATDQYEITGRNKRVLKLFSLRIENYRNYLKSRFFF